jgi:hypothetical protein
MAMRCSMQPCAPDVKENGSGTSVMCTVACMQQRHNQQSHGNTVAEPAQHHVHDDNRNLYLLGFQEPPHPGLMQHVRTPDLRQVQHKTPLLIQYFL